MRLEIKIGAVRDTHQLVPLALFLFTFRKETILNVDGTLGVMRQLFFRLFVKPEVVIRNSDRLKPLMTSIDPVLVRGFVFARFDKVFHLHLFELARAKYEVAGRDFVAKRFADLRDTEGKFAPAGV